MQNTPDINEYNQLLARIYKVKKRMIFGEARKKVECDEDAEDALHNAFIKMMEKYPFYKFKTYKDLTHLCCKSAVHAAIDISRMKTRRRNKLQEAEMKEEIDFGLTKAPLDLLIEKCEEELLVKAISELPQEEFGMLYLQYVYELKPKEIAESLGISATNVRVRMFRSRNKLTEILEKEEYQDLFTK